LIFLGIPPVVAVGSEAPHVLASSVSGVIAHWRKKNVDFKMGFFLLLGGVAGSTLGVNIFKLLSSYGQIDIVIQFLFIIFLGFIGISMAFESARTTIKNYRTTSAIRTKLHQHSWIHGLPFKLRFHRSKLYISTIPPIIIGFFVGVLSAMMGVGGGFIMIPAMVYILGMSTNVVVGTSLFQIIFVTANSTFFQSYLNQTVDIVLSALMILGGVIGAQIGVRIGSKLKAEYLRGILAILVLLVCAKILTGLILTPSDLFTTSIL
nr:sulfite exporter TauE/SafE family protein [Pelagibacteraceae bacterium]